MNNFIIQISIVVSLGIIIYLLARAAPRINDNQEISHTPNGFDKLMNKVPTAKIDAALNVFFEKLLRKCKVVVMKFDNLIERYINKFRKNDKLK